MRKKICEISSKEFELSREEAKFFSLRGLELPNRSEMERLRIVCSVIPEPDFSDQKSVSFSPSNLNCRTYNALQMPNTEVPPFVEENFADLKIIICNFFQVLDWEVHLLIMEIHTYLGR